MRKEQLNRSWLFVGIIILLASCNPQRKVFKAPLKEEGAEYIFTKLKEHELKFDWFNAKFSADYQNKNSRMSLNGQIRIRKDSLIWISFSPMLGIEAIRIMISQDSIKFMNRMNDTYFFGDYDYLNKFLNTNIDFDILQSFLLGNDLSFYENGKFRASIEDYCYKLSTADRSKLKKFVRNSQENLKILIQNIWLDPVSFKIVHADVKEIRRDNIKLDATYDKFENIDNQLFPSKMNYKIAADNMIFVESDFSKITINVPLQFPFKVPASYKKIGTD